MTYGFEVYNPTGRLLFSSRDATWTLLGVYTAPANTSTSFTGVPVMPERIVTRLMVGQVTGDDEAYVHTYSLYGNTLTVTAPSAGNTVTTFFMVMGR